MEGTIKMTTARAKYLPALLCALSITSLACEKNKPEPVDGSAVSAPGAGDGVREGEPDTDKERDEIRKAEVDIDAAKGKEIDGEAKLTTTATGVRIVVEVEDAPPGSKGIHIHEKGDCSDIAGKSMGDHFAPDGHNHALPDQGQRHLGDLGNIEVGENGKGRLDITVEGANLKKDDPKSFLGKALVIHESTDKGSAEQPSGDSGTPMGCGVVKES